MSSPKSASELLNMFYLDMRSALVETAATFDRIERAEGGEAAMNDPRVDAMRMACHEILSEEPGRVRRILEGLSMEEGA